MSRCLLKTVQSTCGGHLVADGICRRQKPRPVASESTEPTDSGPSPHLPGGKARDWSLKPGETFSIKIGGGGSSRKQGGATGGDGDLLGSESQPAKAQGGSAFGLGGGLLPPPPPPAGRR